MRLLFGTAAMLATLALLAVPAAGVPGSTFGVELANNVASAPGAPRGGSATFATTTATGDGSKPPPIRSWWIDLPLDQDFGAPVFAVAPGTCDRDALFLTGTCPDDARLGVGSVTMRLDFGPFGVLSAGWTLYRGAQCSADAVGCIESEIKEETTGVVIIQSAAAIRMGDHVRLQFDGIRSPHILGIEPSITMLKVAFDRSAMLETGVPGNQTSVLRNFIENPTTCTAAGWTYTSTLTFADGSSSSAGASVACQPIASTTPPNVSADITSPQMADITPPQISITHPTRGQRIRSRRFVQVHGTAADASGIERVEYALARIARHRQTRSGAAARRSITCRFLQGSGRLRKRFTSCLLPRYLTANGSTEWHGRVRRALPRGRYAVLVRATDTQKNTSPPQTRRFIIT